MKLYHGTSWYAGKKIIDERKLRVTTKDNSIYKDAPLFYQTTPGYVYLTCSCYQGFRWGKNALFDVISNADNKKLADKLKMNMQEWLSIFIFEVNILDISNLEPDYDECKHRFKSGKLEKCLSCSTANCIEKIASVRCNHDLLLPSDVKRYKIVTTFDPSHEKEMIILHDWVDL